jgi:hypothetical protein
VLADRRITLRNLNPKATYLLYCSDPKLNLGTLIIATYPKLCLFLEDSLIFNGVTPGTGANCSDSNSIARGRARPSGSILHLCGFPSLSSSLHVFTWPTLRTPSYSILEVPTLQLQVPERILGRLASDIRVPHIALLNRFFESLFRLDDMRIGF